MKNFMKVLGVILCLGAITVFALIESGVSIPFFQNYKNNFKRNISGIANVVGIELPLEVQLYLDDMSTPMPKPTMTPADEMPREDKQQKNDDARRYRLWDRPPFKSF